MKTEIYQIHESFVNGQRKQAVKQILNYGASDFFNEYNKDLFDLYASSAAFDYLREATDAYFTWKDEV